MEQESAAREKIGTVWLEFTRDVGEGVPIALPVQRIEYVAKKDDGRAYIACYRERRKKELRFGGYDTKELYEEIIERLKNKEDAEK